MRQILPAIFLFAQVFSVGAAFGKELTLRVVGPAETVFAWKSQNCGQDHMPDSPARAVRLSDGRIYLLASLFTNIPMIGATFGTLEPACKLSSRGSQNPKPKEYDDRVWIQALTAPRGGRIYALASHEYAGSRHAGQCSVKGGACWYSSITALSASEAELVFRPLSKDSRVVATSPDSYDPSMQRRAGFFSTTNVVHNNAHNYALVYTEGIRGQPNGMCLLRAPSVASEPKWRALFNGAFDADLSGSDNPAVREASPVCDILGPGIRGRNVRSILTVDGGGAWIAVFMHHEGRSSPDYTASGVYYSISDDLIHWGKPKLLLEVTPFLVQKEAGVYYQYPSLLDHASSSAVFDEYSGETFLYLVRYNLWPDRRDGGNRDLVRFRVELSR